jgi:hypothetical protein
MSGSKRFIVLESQDHVDVLKECIEFLALTAPETKLKVISTREASTILYFLTRDAVDTALAHRVGDTSNVEAICAILYGIGKTSVTKNHLDAYEAIRTHSLWMGVEHNLRIQLKQYIPLDCWTDWTVIKSSGLLGLTEGEDHRITEFNKLAKGQPVNEDETEEAVATINCSNPINYLYNQFIQRYGDKIHTAQQHMSQPGVQMDSFYRKMMSDFFANPTEQIAAIFCEGITRVNPQIELAEHCPTVNQVLLKILNIYDMETFHREVVSKLVIAFGMGQISYSVKKDESYKLEFYTGTNIISIFKKLFSTITEKYEEELLHALNRGDYLPYEERKVAERVFAERANMVLNLRQ